ncbi:sulfotransferase domain-containing protein [Streptomyces sp. NBC_00876]|nr:sulfotransferase domain-containing protein [Streptomyces sp. NBC_00876]
MVRRSGSPALVPLSSYERLAVDASGEVARIPEFCGLPRVDQEVLRKAVEYAGFSSMRAMELGDAFDSERLRPGRPGDPEPFKTRRGGIGGFRAYLTEAQIGEVDSLIRAALVPEWHALAFAAGDPAVAAGAFRERTGSPSSPAMSEGQ